MNKVRVLIVIPAYNEEKNILKVVENLRRNFSQYDYVVINDGSEDRTRKICMEHNVNLLDLPVNLGLSGAIRSGMKYANFYDYDYVIQLDGDGQHQPQYIEKMLNEMRNSNADIVIGSRFKSKKKPFTVRMLGSRIISWAIWVTTGKHIGDVTSGMRLFNKKMIKKFGYQMNYSPEPDTIAYLLNCGFKISEVQVEMLERQGGESYLSIGRSLSYMMHRLFAIFIFQWVRVRMREEN